MSFPGGITPDEPITAVDQAGGEADEAAVLRPRPLVSLLTAVPVVVPMAGPVCRPTAHLLGDSAAGPCDVPATSRLRTDTRVG